MLDHALSLFLWPRGFFIRIVDMWISGVSRIFQGMGNPPAGVFKRLDEHGQVPKAMVSKYLHVPKFGN